MSEPFIDLSRGLTGEEDLDLELAEEYEHRIRDHFGDLLDRFDDEYRKFQPPGSADREPAVQAALDQDPKFHSLAREIIRLWYTGQFSAPHPFNDPDLPREVEHYRKGLLWRVIKAHPPGFTNSGYGAWAKLPDDV